MKPRHKIIVSALAVASVAAGVGMLLPHHIWPPQLYPNSTISPGLVATSDFAELTAVNSCGTYSACHRNTTEAQKTIVRNEYPSCPQAQEIDHIVPLALGGADDVRNLWCQPKVNVWNGTDYGYPTKDKLEAYMVIQMKAGKIAPTDAQNCILADWVGCYNRYIGGQPTFGGVNNSVADPDDEVVE